jgi:hypothetical protein
MLQVVAAKMNQPREDTQHTALINPRTGSSFKFHNFVIKIDYAYEVYSFKISNDLSHFNF